jgi:hypothetical protein
MISDIFWEPLGILSLLHDPCVVILVFFVNLSFGKVIHHFEELPDLFIILKQLPVLDVVWYGRSIPHFYVVP